MRDKLVKAKSTLQYHFTSDIQEMYNLDKIVRHKVNKMTVQLKLGKLLALSVFLQKSVSNMTKTHQEYNTKPVTVSIVEILEDKDKYTSELVGGYDDELSYPSSESAYTNTGYVESHIGLEFDEAMENKEEIKIHYMSAVKIHPTPQLLFTMVTGCFHEKFAGFDVIFMIDMGSELNLMSLEPYEKTSLVINLDGTCWFLKGINRRPVPLGSCVQDAEIKISG